MEEKLHRYPQIELSSNVLLDVGASDGQHHALRGSIHT